MKCVAAETPQIREAMQFTGINLEEITVWLRQRDPGVNTTIWEGMLLIKYGIIGNIVRASVGEYILDGPYGFSNIEKSKFEKEFTVLRHD